MGQHGRGAFGLGKWPYKTSNYGLSAVGPLSVDRAAELSMWSATGDPQIRACTSIYGRDELVISYR
jgi:hypothetical protein